MCVHGRDVGVIARGTAGGREPVGLLFAIDMVVHLLLNGTSLVTPMSVYLTLVLCANSTSLTSSCSLAFVVNEFPSYTVETHGLYYEVHKSLGPTDRAVKAAAS